MLTIEQLDALMEQALTAQSLAEFITALPPSGASSSANADQHLDTHSDELQSN